jgi:peptidoglycan/xylan/chitin deacetylase (PgdA/CDA1 family)
MLSRGLVLAYHGVGDASETNDPETLLVSTDLLRSHVTFLRRRRYGFMTMAAALDAFGGGPPAERVAVLTFDDGFRNWVTNVLPLLRDMDVPASFYACPGWDGGQHPEVSGPEGELLDRDGLRLLHDAGMEVASHSMTHPDLRKLEDAALATELTESKVAIEEVTGGPCRTFAYPYGLFDDRVKRATEAAGYEMALDWLPGTWQRYAVPRLPGPPRHGAGRLALKMLGLRKPGR